VKLSQKAPEVAPAPSPSPSISPKGDLRSKSIVCVKGKVKKKISGTNPKCPTGYKKVSA
jgi:hypothetical protein